MRIYKVTINKFLLSLLMFFALQIPAQAQQELSIGVLAFRGEQATLERWLPTAEYLGDSLPGYSFKIVPLSLEGMESAVKQDQIDFILTNTGNYVVLEYSLGISRLATLKARHLGEDFTQFGAVIFTRQDEDELNSIEDIAGHSMMAVSERAFGGFQMAWREMIEVGVDPFEDLLSLQFSGFPQDDIVFGVLAGKVDVGTVRSGTLERMAADNLIDIEMIKPLGSRRDGSFPFLLSTRLYPEWPFAKARKTPEQLAQRVAIALLELAADSHAAEKAFVAGWTIPLDYGPVHELFRKLEIGPYRYLNKPSLVSVWREYKTWIVFSLGMILILLALIALLGRANRRISLSELKFREEASQRKHAQELLAAHQETLETSVKQRTFELAEVNTSLRRSESTLRAIHDITTDAEIEFDAKLLKLLNEGCRFFRMEFAAIAHLVDGVVTLPTIVQAVSKSSAGNLAAIASWLTQELQLQGTPVAISVLKEYSFENAPGDDIELSGSAIGCGYSVDDQVAGYMVFCDLNAEGRVFSEVDIDILQLMAQWLGGEIERAEINRRSQEHQAHLAHVARLNTMGEMATSIAHELNQPLTAILNYSNGCLRLLQKGGERNNELHRAIENVGKDAKRAAGIIKRLREFIKTGDIRQERLLIRDCIEPAVELLRPKLVQQGITVDIRYAENVSYVVADRIQIEQVVVNLLLNAIDALQTPDLVKQEINLTVTSSESHNISVAISDTGKGLPDDVVSRLFDPFFSTKSDGMGMGLSISRTIVESHGGSIEYLVNEQEQPTFRFTLPLT